MLVPENGSESDSDATVNYRNQQSSLLVLVEGDEDILIELPSDFRVPDFVSLDGDKFASWLARQAGVKAGTVTPERQRRYAKEIRLAKLVEFKSHLDNGALRLADRRKLPRDVNFLTGRWVLTVRQKWLMATFLSSRRDGFAGDSRISMPGNSRPTVLLLLAMDSDWLLSAQATAAVEQ